MLQANSLLKLNSFQTSKHTHTHTHTTRHITMMHWIFTLLWICVLVAPATRHSFIFISWYFYRFSPFHVRQPTSHHIPSCKIVRMNKYRRLDPKSFHSTLVHRYTNLYIQIEEMRQYENCSGRDKKPSLTLR